MEALIPFLSAAFAGGAAWGAVKAALNGTAKRVERIETKVDSAAVALSDVSVRVARLEGAWEAERP